MVEVGRILVLRHAQSVWNAAGRWQGWSDAPLSELGEQQARQAGRALRAAGAHPEAMACSDLLRARRTAELIAAELGFGAPLIVDPDLREQDLGYWNGLTSDEIAQKWPAELDGRRSGRLLEVPGGEDGTVFAERCLGALLRIAAQPAEEVVTVAHGGVVIALERAIGVFKDGNHHRNLSGWWVEAKGAPPDLELVPLQRVDLLAAGVETVPGPA
jgi:broad specificity phosphatase PhoE